MPSTTHASMHSALLRKKSDALRSSARSGYLMRRLRHAVSRPCDAICAVLEPSAVLRVVRCGRCCSHFRFCDELIADALSPLPRACGASAHQLAAADAPCAASGADAFWCHTVALVLFPEAAAPGFGRPRVAIHEDLDAVHSGYPLFAAGASDQPPNSCQDGPGRGPVGWDRPLMAFFVSDARRAFLLTVWKFVEMCLVSLCLVSQDKSQKLNRNSDDT